MRQKLFGNTDPTGETIRLKSVSCEVIGLLQVKGASTFGQDQDDTILAPIRMLQRRISGSTDVASIRLALAPGVTSDRGIREIEALMRERRRIGIGEEDDFSVTDMAEISSMLTGIINASYFKNDFQWANHQLKVLKSASTQLIANDALDLFLLISDNTVEDSTQVALKKFARADFLLFQKKTSDALAAFQTILKEHKGEPIEPVALLRIGKMYEAQNDFTSALSQYKQILDNHKECIYIDEALYFSAEIYNQLKDFDNAKPLYEALIMNHEDSIYFVNAQKKYRQLRGDKDL